MAETMERSRNRYQFDMDQIRHWYEDEGASVREVARRAGTSDRTMWRHMNAAGIRMRPAGNSGPPVVDPVSPAEAQAIRAALEEARQTGERQIDIARRFGRSEVTIRRIERNERGDSRRSTGILLAAIRAVLDEVNTWTGPDSVADESLARGAQSIREKISAALADSAWAAAVNGGPSREPRRRGRPADVVAEQKVRELHASGLRGKQIDAECGWRGGKAGDIQKRLGLDPRKPRSDPGADELRALYAELRTVMAVASRLGCSDGRVSRLLKDAGITIKPGGLRRHPLDAHEEAIRRERPHATILELAERYGVPFAVMSGWLDHRGITTYHIVTAAEHDEIVRLGGEGLSLGEIGRRLGRPSITIKKHLEPASRPRLK